MPAIAGMIAGRIILIIVINGRNDDQAGKKVNHTGLAGKS